MPRHKLREWLRGFDWDKYRPRRCREPPSPEELVRYALVKRLRREPIYDRTCWFHLTRTAFAEGFEEGILPLPQSLSYVWSHLERIGKPLVGSEAWEAFKAAPTHGCGDNHYAKLFSMKTSSPIHAGPWALLVKEAAFHANEIGNVDYLRGPEIVEDICICFKERFGVDLLSRFREIATPCIVKFWSDRKDLGEIDSALNYLYDGEKTGQLTRLSNWCFNGKGNRVPREQILRIETVGKPP